MHIWVLIVAAIVVACGANVPPTEDYPHQTVLDSADKVVLYWKVDEIYITFELHGNTTGWVGMGISPNGAMTGADIVVGWVKDGVAMVTDRHGVGNTFPPIDPEQNIELLDGMESNGWTVIKFRRQLASCEPGYDLPITGDTLKIIYAFGENDPSGNDISSADYHNANRGSKSLILLGMSGRDEDNFPQGEIGTHQTFALLNDEFEIPEDTTYYNCRLHKIPEFSEKQHMVKVEPIIQPGNELIVHHIVVYQCLATVNEESLGTNTRCYSSNMPPDFLTCGFIIQAWAIGGTAIYYPKHAGFPLGETDSPKYVVVETHYDNPRALAGVRDSSGLRFTYTPVLRQYDAGIIEAGHAVSGIQHIIPPNALTFLSHGECSSQCLEQSLLQAGVESINIFGVELHSHLLGAGLTVRHIRNGTELPYIAKDNAYDFNYQETRRLSEERVVLPGDSMQVICNYKSEGVRQDITVGGLDTSKEMCIAFLYYYPKLTLSFCETAPELYTFLNYFNVSEITTSVQDFGIYNDLYDMEIVQPENLAGQNLGKYINAVTWNDDANKRLEEAMRDIVRVRNCKGFAPINGVDYYGLPPVIDVPYIEEELVCYNSTSQTTTPSVTTTATEIENIPPTEEYPHQATLDSAGKVILYWKVDETHITFELHGKTTGWVGMGISPNGAMTGADIVVGWVKNGAPMVTDRHGVGNTFPPIDPEQNIELLDGMESDGWTVIKFRRQLASCEPGYDLPITGDTLKIIYAFGDADPEGNDITGGDYHGNNRGVKSLLLLGMAGSSEENFPVGEIESHKTFDLLNDNFEIPAETTYYNCRLHKIPEFNEKQHLVKIEPIIQSGNEKMVHHILVYQCLANVNENESLGTNTRCYGSDMPPDFQSCSLVIQAWAIGGTDIYYPKHAGFPLGETDSPKYVVLETHYDNPNALSGVRDSSGLRFTYTPVLRQYDAGIIQAGHAVSGVQHLIPPNDDFFLSIGECSSQCMEQSLSQAGLQNINIFGVNLHSHLLGAGMTVRHIRNKTELPYLSKDSSYDFNYQETRKLPEERVVLPGDTLQVICDYKTKGVRTEMTVGGLETEKEMCIAFIYYYPKFSMAYCETAPEYSALMNYFGINSARPTVPNFGIYNDINDFVILSPESLAGKNMGEYLNEMTWDDVTNQKFEDDLREMTRLQNCRGLQPIDGVDYSGPAPMIDVPFIEEEPICYNSTSQTTTDALPPMTTTLTEPTTTDVLPPMTTTSTEPTTASVNIPPTEEYPHQATLDSIGKVILYWKVDETHITFELHGKTTGWLGMGISPNGAMTGADIVVGWVKNGVTMITDRHGVGNTFPPIDPEQNVELLGGMESDGWTVIKFRRQLASCEPGYDLPITADTLKIIHAFGDADPQGNDDISGADYHLSNRGSRSLILLGMSGGEESNFPDGEVETHMTFDLLNDNFEIPEERTYYNCRLHKIPEFNEKQHVVKIEPVVQAGNEIKVHHILVYQCIGSINETESLGTNTRCFGSDMPPDFQSCSFVIVAWAIGGTAQYYPTHTGYPLGEADSPKYVVVETHYDNPMGDKGVRDSSGLRFTYTSKLRQYDAGILQTGHAVRGFQHLIPPNDESFLSYGECSEQCLRQALLQDGMDSINVFGVLLHSHLVGAGLTVRHIRNTIELPYLSKDDAYDFNYQESRRLPEERVIKTGDSLQVVCDYKTKGVRQDFTVGGLDTEKEMCLAFIYYYPKISNTFCQTAPEFPALLNRFGVLQIRLTAPNFGAYNDIYDMEIVLPEELQGQNFGEYIDAMTWNDTTNQQLEDDLRTITRGEHCLGIHGVPEGVERFIPAPVVNYPYEEKEQVCSTEGNTTPDTEGSGVPPKETTTESVGDPEVTTDGAVRSSSSVLTYLLAFVLSLMFLKS